MKRTRTTLDPKCTTHYICRDELEPAVLAQLRADCAYAKEHEAEFVEHEWKGGGIL